MSQDTTSAVDYQDARDRLWSAVLGRDEYAAAAMVFAMLDDMTMETLYLRHTCERTDLGAVLVPTDDDQSEIERGYTVEAEPFSGWSDDETEEAAIGGAR